MMISTFKMLLILLTLFPFIKQQKYPITIKSIKNDQLMITCEAQDFPVQLFNITLESQGIKALHEMILDGEIFEMEIDPSTKSQYPLQIYLFIDDMLVQEQLLKKGYASINIQNPKYTYAKEMINASRSTKNVMASTHSTHDYGHASVGLWYYVFVIFIWIICLIWMIYRKNKTKNIE